MTRRRNAARAVTALLGLAAGEDAGGASAPRQAGLVYATSLKLSKYKSAPQTLQANFAVWVNLNCLDGKRFCRGFSIINGQSHDSHASLSNRDVSTICHCPVFRHLSNLFIRWYFLCRIASCVFLLRQWCFLSA